jgi:hypothetical protein
MANKPGYGARSMAQQRGPGEHNLYQCNQSYRIKFPRNIDETKQTAQILHYLIILLDCVRLLLSWIAKCINNKQTEYGCKILQLFQIS